MTDFEKTSKSVIQLLKTDIQFKGENCNEQYGLYLSDIEYNLKIIKNEIKNDIIFKKVVTIDYLYSIINKNQYLYVIYPERLNSKFYDDLLNYKNS